MISYIWEIKCSLIEMAESENQEGQWQTLSFKGCLLRQFSFLDFQVNFKIMPLKHKNLYLLSHLNYMYINGTPCNSPYAFISYWTQASPFFCPHTEMFWFFPIRTDFGKQPSENHPGLLAGLLFTLPFFPHILDMKLDSQIAKFLLQKHC